MYSFTTRGTCSRQIDFDIQDGVITYVKFYGGCNGNLKAIAKLVEGKKPEEVIGLLKGITCGFKDTSCPDQLSIALEKAMAQNA